MRKLVGILYGILGSALFVPGLALTPFAMVRAWLYRATSYCLLRFRAAGGLPPPRVLDRTLFPNRAAFRRWKARHR